MELQFEVMARCHPHDIWAVLVSVEQWQQHTPAFGEAGWVHGEPWNPGSRFFLELRFPQRTDLEVVVLKCKPPYEIVLLSHGGGIASEQWLQLSAQGPNSTLIRIQQALVGATAFSDADIRKSLQTLHTSWLGGLKSAAERHCSLIAQ